MKKKSGVVATFSIPTAFTIVMIGPHGNNIGPEVIAPTLEFAGAVVDSHQQQIIRDNREAVTGGRTPVEVKIKITDADKKPVALDAALAAYAAWANQKTMAA